MSIKEILKPLLALEGLEQVTPEQHIAALSAVLEANVFVDTLEVFAEPDELPADDEADPLQGEADALIAEIRDMTAKQIEREYNRDWFKRATALLGVSNKGKQLVVAQRLLDSIED